MIKRRKTSRINHEPDSKFHGNFNEAKEWLEQGAYLRIIHTEKQKTLYWICDDREAYIIDYKLFALLAVELELQDYGEYRRGKMTGFYMRLNQ